MADTSRAEVLTYLENANMMEISELIGEIEEKFGVIVTRLTQNPQGFSIEKKSTLGPLVLLAREEVRSTPPSNIFTPRIHSKTSKMQLFQNVRKHLNLRNQSQALVDAP